MTKTNTKNQNKSLALILTTIGFLLIASALFITPIIAQYLNADCELDKFGTCPFEVSLPNAIVAQKIAVACGVVGAVILASGIFTYYRNKK